MAIARYWLPYNHINAIQAAEGAILAAVCDVNESAAANAAQRSGLSTHYTDLNDMLRNEQLDAISIATRTRERLSIIEAAVAAGIKGIYCEKPVANSLEITDHIAEMIRDNNVHFIYGTRRRHMSAFRQAKSEIDAGNIGDLTGITVQFGRSMLFWTHPHSVDIASYFAGDTGIAYVQADLSLDPKSVDDQLIDADPIVEFGNIVFDNDIHARIVVGTSWDVELSGTEGSISVQGNGSAIRLRHLLPGVGDKGWFPAEKNIVVENRPTGATAGFTALVNALNDGRDSGYNVNLAVANQEVLFGFVYSHLQDGARIRLPLERRDLVITGRYGDLYA